VTGMPGRKTFAVHFAVLVLFSVLAVLMTLPLAFHLGDALPGGFGDPLFAAWKLDWNFQRLQEGMSGYWNAPIYHPLPDSFAFADHFLGVALVALPFYVAGDGLVLSWNLYFLLTFAVSSFGAYLLAFKFTNSRPASLVAGVIFGFCHYRFSHIGHLESLSTQWLPFIFLFMWRFVERPSFGDAIGLAAFASLQSLSSTHYAIYLFLLGVPLFLGLIVALRRKPTARLLLLCLIPAVSLGAVLLPFAVKYSSVARERGFSRSLRDVEYYAATLRSHASVPPHNLLLGNVLAPFEPPAPTPEEPLPDVPRTRFGTVASPRAVAEDALFPGLLASFFAIFAIAFVERDGPMFAAALKLPSKLQDFNINSVSPRELSARIAFVLLLLVAAYSFFLALGGGGILWPSRLLLPWLRSSLLVFTCASSVFLLVCLNSRSRRAAAAWWKRKPTYVKAFGVLGTAAFILTFRIPFSLLFLAFPPLRATRVPTRFTAVTMLAVSVLAAAFFAALLRRLRSKKRIALASSLVVVALLFEYAPRGLPLARLGDLTPGSASVADDQPPVYQFLRSLPESHPALELPFSRDPAYLYYQTYHRRPLVNGYAAFEPRPAMRRTLAGFPASGSLRSLRNLSVDLVVVHLWAYEDQDRRKFLQLLDDAGDSVTCLADFNGDLVYWIRPR